MDDVRIAIRMSERERDFVLKHVPLSMALHTKLSLGLRQEGALAFFLDEREARELAAEVRFEAKEASSPKVRRTLERLSAAIEKAMADQARHPAGEKPARESLLSGEVQDALRELLASRPGASLDEINAELSRLTEAYNNREQAAFQGLSPKEVSRLIYTPWEGPEAGLRCRDDLPPEKVADTEIVHNARVLLRALLDEGGTKATATRHNLNRKFVEAMLDALRLPEGYADEVRRFSKAINEEDVWPLHILRIVVELAGLVRLRKGSFQVSGKGTALLAEEKAGALYALLFRTYWMDFNIAYVDPYGADLPAMQETFCYSVCVLGRKAREWRTVEELTAIILLPSLVEAFREYEAAYEGRARWLILARLLLPLERFGLVECARDDQHGRLYDRVVERVRVTPLYDEFLEFFPGDGGQ